MASMSPVGMALCFVCRVAAAVKAAAVGFGEAPAAEPAVVEEGVGVQVCFARRLRYRKMGDHSAESCRVLG